MSSRKVLNSWFIPLTPPHELAKMRLFCFHYAGGSASLFRPWVKEIINPIELIGVQLPGRETRFSETPYYNLKNLIKNLVEVFSGYIDQPFIFFGHSVGALVSFELARALRNKGSRLPVHLIVSGAKAPHITFRGKRIHNLPKEEFIKELQLYNGIHPDFAEDKELLNLFIPTIRADFSLSETYTYLDGDPLSCSITAFGGRDDSHVFIEDILSWQDQTNSNFIHHFFKGDHFFFMKESYQQVLKIINEILKLELIKYSF